MNTKTPSVPADPSLTIPAHLHAIRDVSLVGGAVAGAAIGAIAGPIGAVAGGIIGTAVGALAGETLDEAEARATEHDQLLDREIGVTEGDLGTASPDAPPAVRGVYSGAAAGVGSGGGSVPSGGPMQDLDSE